MIKVGPLYQDDMIVRRNDRNQEAKKDETKKERNDERNREIKKERNQVK